MEHAFHALAIDEHRGPFSPTLWEQPNNPQKLKVLKQCWFPGVHSNIGGSYPDAGISNISLAWMVSQLEDTDGGILSFDAKYLDWIQDMNNKYYASTNEPVKPWGLGKLYDSSQATGLTSRVERFDLTTRTPGRYHVIDTNTGKPAKERLASTNESIHRCVRVRIEEHGPGTEEQPDVCSKIIQLWNLAKKAAGINLALKPVPKIYQSAALKAYDLVHPGTLHRENGASEKAPDGVYWRAKDALQSLPEDTLGRTEIRLLRRSIGNAGL